MGFLWEFYGIFSSDSFRAKADEKIEKLHFINYTLKTEFTCHFRDKFGTLLKLFHSSIYLPATMPHHQTHTHNKKWKIISSCHCTTYDFTELFKSAYKRREREKKESVVAANNKKKRATPSCYRNYLWPSYIEAKNAANLFLKFLFPMMLLPFFNHNTTTFRWLKFLLH